MKIPLNLINPELALTISGDEPWLEYIYKFFPPPAGAASNPKILAQLHFRQIDSEKDLIRVNGKLDYVPFVACSRCSDRIEWPIHAQFECLFARPSMKTNAQQGNTVLEDAACDLYYYDKEHIDVLALINEMIQTEVPLQTVKLEENSDNCKICGRAPLVFRAREENSVPDAASGPFAALKDLVAKTN